MSRPLLIWGCGGHGREVLHLCQESGASVAGFLDERPEMMGTSVDDTPVLGCLADVARLRHDVVVLCAGVGSPALKRRFALQTEAAGFLIAPPLVHPTVRLHPQIRVGAGAVICAGALLTVGISIGAHVTVNLGCTVGHDCVIGDYATVSPGVCISGNVLVDEGAFLGTGSAIREKLRVGPWSIVGGGAFVARDVAARTMVGGVPARHMRDV